MDQPAPPVPHAHVLFADLGAASRGYSERLPGGDTIYVLDLRVLDDQAAARDGSHALFVKRLAGDADGTL